MKIDIHTHTKQCKSGDAPSREIGAAAFCEAVRATEVGIIAITNHNVFDLDQFEEIIEEMSGDAQVWPGIELDVVDDGARGHLLVIVSPDRAKEFAGVVSDITARATPDKFQTTIEEVLERFDALGPLYVAHYKQKRPNLSDEALEKLISGTENPCRVIKEVANSISAGIYISHGHASIYGSDIHDWAKYEEEARDLPDLRLPVESFEHFCLLLEKDATTINTVLDKKEAEDLVLDPFNGAALIKLKVFNDINVVFGPKGTGKSCILKAISKHFCDNGIEAYVYVSDRDLLDTTFDLRGKSLSLNLASFGISYCKDEIEKLRESQEVSVTSLSRFVSHFSGKKSNKNSRKIKLKDIEQENLGGTKREFTEFNEAVAKIGDFIAFLQGHRAVEEELEDDELTELQDTLTSILKRFEAREWNSFSKWKEVAFMNSAIQIFRTETGRKTGIPDKPTTTGFRDYAINRAKIEANAKAIINSVDSKIPVEKKSVGNLGPNKGTLELRTELVFQDGGVTDSTFEKLKNIKKGSLKTFAKTVRDIEKHAYREDIFQYITTLNAIEGIEEIETVYELLLFKRYFALDSKPYSPSSGEASMVMLQKELESDKEVYILDEPERSLGNEYINDVIVPLIKERARAGKKVFISTHDANIAVRTLPYCSVYRCHGPGGYATYVGNPFSNNLVNLDDETDKHDWKKISMRTLEGGEEAFGERGKIYGNI
jgi:ABC-type cobalamin/Fe3+-siderophores transport system ATPase subunit/predicted metal-dependent phosphoesterase TrpH